MRASIDGKGCVFARYYSIYTPSDTQTSVGMFWREATLNLAPF